ncbi:hypothetical protein [Pseudarthrobacter sp. NamE5]|uniref:hypothetical protein n=1 Tax=Pseudarthrobacter sp. NamE5 TaxID=2576839 RepID=UPI00110B6FF1|nr:hypothetical protein [Pseudarthrobacter sp. NamE5]TLM80827.1 hypothetical protein FDW84_18430 [Pseudarthrobacter sp. NamE5]
MLWFVVGGFCFGALVAGLNAVSRAHPALVALSQVLGVGWSWAGLGVLAGAYAVRRPAMTAIATLLFAVVGYYLTDLWNGVYTHNDPDDPVYYVDPTQARVITSWDGLVGDISFWGVAAVAFGLMLGPVGAVAVRSNWWGLLCRLVVPIGATVEMFVLRLPLELQLQPRPVVVATMVVVGLAGLIAAGAMCFHQLKVGPATTAQPC